MTTYLFHSMEQVVHSFDLPSLNMKRVRKCIQFSMERDASELVFLIWLMEGIAVPIEWSYFVKGKRDVDRLDSFSEIN